MRNKNGFSLTELLVSIVVASILILTIGVLSSIANGSFNKISSEQQTYNDISYGFKLMQNRVRIASSMSKTTTKPNPPWVNSEELVVDNVAFGLYQASGGTKRDFVYLADKNDETNRETIFTVPDANLSWTLTCNPSSCSSPKSITLILTGKKDNIPFDMETTVMKRN